MIDNLEYYKVFYYTAKSGSVTGAAALLSISQPAVSQSLKLLERNLGVTLFRREPKGMKLTAEGDTLYSYVEKGMELLELGTEKVLRMKNLDLGEVHIGASDMTLRFYLLPYLEKFHDRYPNINVVVSNGPTPETLKALKEGRIDFGIVSTPFPQEEGLEVRKVRQIEDVFVAGRNFLQLKHKTLDFQELERLPMISLENNTSTRSYMDQFLAEKGIVLKPEFELATSDMIVQFALRNLGVGCVVRDFAMEALEAGTLFELRFNQMIPKRSFCLVKNSGMVLPAAAERLLQICSESETSSGE